MSDNTLRELVYGKGAHVSPLACVDDIHAELAVRTVASYPHSIWQIISHMNYWMDYDMRRMAGERPPYPEHAQESWPSSAGPASEEEWLSQLRRFGSLLDKLMALSAADRETLQRHVEPTHPSHETRASTVEAMLWQTLVHNSYHIGQIAMLRRCFGVWPPKRGSDTW